MSRLDNTQLGLVERWTLGLALGLIVVSWFTMSRKMSLGVSVGAGLMALNAFALRKIGLRVVKNANRPGAAILLFNLKMAVLIAAVYLTLKLLPVDAVGFLIGVSVFPVAVVAAAIHMAISPPPRDLDPEPTGDK